jgi:DNA-binding CsgD family transcriptional regulator
MRIVITHATPPVNHAPDFLTHREREILQSGAESHRTREITAKFGMIAKTVGNHRTSPMRQLNLFDDANVTPYALAAGFSEQKKPV